MLSNQLVQSISYEGHLRFPDNQIILRDYLFFSLVNNCISKLELIELSKYLATNYPSSIWIRFTNFLLHEDAHRYLKIADLAVIESPICYKLSPKKISTLYRDLFVAVDNLDEPYDVVRDYIVAAFESCPANNNIYGVGLRICAEHADYPLFEKMYQIGKFTLMDDNQVAGILLGCIEANMSYSDDKITMMMATGELTSRFGEAELRDCLAPGESAFLEFFQNETNELARRLAGQEEAELHLLAQFLRQAVLRFLQILRINPPADLLGDDLFQEAEIGELLTVSDQDETGG